MVPFLSLKEVFIITSSLEKWPEKVVDCLVRFIELLGNLRTWNPFQIRGGKTCGFKDGGLSISISHNVTPDSHLGNKSDIFHHNHKNNQLERRVWPPRDIH